MQASDRARKMRRADSKFGARKVTPGNRYHRRAKASEYTTLKLLKGFADDRPAPDFATSMHVSGKTLRNVYMRFRRKLIPATRLQPMSFGGAGLFLYRRDGLSPTGLAILASIRESGLYRRHMRRHAPRLAEPSDETLFLFEVTVRMFCHIAITKTPETIYSTETIEALRTLQDMAEWIAANSVSIVGQWQHSGMLKLFGGLGSRLEHLAAFEALWSLRNHSREHPYPSHVLYNDLRRYLLSDPL